MCVLRRKLERQPSQLSMQVVPVRQLTFEGWLLITGEADLELTNTVTGRSLCAPVFLDYSEAQREQTKLHAMVPGGPRYRIVQVSVKAVEDAE